MKYINAEITGTEATFIKPSRSVRNTFASIAFVLMFIVAIGAMVALMYSSLGMPITSQSSAGTSGSQQY